MTENELWRIGSGGWIAAGRIIAVGNWESAPIRRAVRKARTENRLIDLTYGQACRWVVFMDNGQVILSSRELKEDN